jgi:oligopeptide transport system substrate-binding protein
MARRNGRSMRGQSAIILTLALAALLAGCALPSLPALPWQQHGRAPLPDAQQVLHVTAQAGNVTGAALDPLLLSNTRSGVAHILPLLYSGLFTLDANQRIVPALASHYAVSADGLRYTFTLRSDARFSDGARITSADVAFSLNLTMSPCEDYGTFVFYTLKDQPHYAQQSCTTDQLGAPTFTATPGQPLLPTLIGDALLTPDPHTLIIVLSRPDGALPAKLAEPYSAVVEQSVVQRYGANWVNHLADHGGQGTSGMYTVSGLTSVVDGGTQVTLTRAKTYWGAAPRLREVIVNFVNSHNESLIPPGDVTFVTGMSPDPTGGPILTPPDVSNLPGFHQGPARDEDYLLLNPANPGMGDIRVRQALALALDKPALATLMRGVATNHLIPPQTGDYPAIPSGIIATAPLTGDVAQAQALWQSYVRDRCSGVASRCPAVPLWYEFYDMSGADPFEQTFDQAVAQQWRAALPGIRVDVQGIFFGLMPDVSDFLSVSYLNWDEDFPDPQDWAQPFAKIPGDSTYVPYVHEAQVDALVAQAEATPDPTARLARYQQVENTLLTDAIVVPIAQEQDAWAVKPTVVNFPANPSPWIPPAVWARIYLTAPAAK